MRECRKGVKHSLALPLLALGELLSHAGTPASRALRQKHALLDLSLGSQFAQKLAALVPPATPQATLFHRLSATVSATLTKAAADGGNTTNRRVLERAQASELAPPGTSPPTQSVRKIPIGLHEAGQQNRISGAILDAKTAREIPAPQESKTAPAPPVQRADEHALQPPQNPAPAPDILTRILARAAAADVQRPLPAHAAPVVSGQPTHAAQSGQTPAQIFARLMNVVAEASNERPARDGGKQSQQFTDTQTGSSSFGAPAFSTALSSASAQAVPAAPSATPNPLDPQAVIEQVVKGIVLRNFGSTSEVRMRLQPEHLGDVSLKLTVSGNTISATIVAQNADVRAMLMDNQQQLARAFAQAGLALGKFSVDVSGGNPGFPQQQSAQQPSLSKAGALRATLGAEEEPWTDAVFGSLAGGPKPWVLNYLA